MGSKRVKDQVRDGVEQQIDALHKVADIVTFPLAPIDGAIHGVARGLLNWVTDNHPDDHDHDHKKSSSRSPSPPPCKTGYYSAPPHHSYAPYATPAPPAYHGYPSHAPPPPPYSHAPYVAPAPPQPYHGYPSHAPPPAHHYPPPPTHAYSYHRQGAVYSYP